MSVATPYALPRPAISDLARHLPSHRHLLRTLATQPAYRATVPALDAIVMPTNRRLDESRSGVRLAAALARTLRPPDRPPPTFVLLCSGAARSEHLPREQFAGIDILTIDLRPDHVPLWPRFRTDHHLLTSYRRRGNDVGLKRNLGLVLARSQGWKNVLMLDDDVAGLVQASGPSPGRPGLPGLADALLALGEEGSRCVGWVMDDFPDNSVVCHARRQLGLEQDNFIGGGALLLRADLDVPFFPAIYNEDWLFLLPFMLNGAGNGRAVIEGGLVRQDPYQVFVTRRAMSEELGDMLGEGLLNLLGHSVSTFRDLCGDYGYWRDVVRARREMIESMLVTLSSVRGPELQMQPALEAALRIHEEMDDWSSTLAIYCRRWLEDIATWSDWLSSVGRSEPAALGFERR